MMFIFLLVTVALLLKETSLVLAQQQQPSSSSFKLLKQLHVITRHGARTMLAKDADTLSEQGGATLTPLGQQQLYDLGVWLRQTYNSTSSSTPNNLSLGYYNPAWHRLESSDLDRTVSSAHSLALGLFPNNQRATGIFNETGSAALMESLLPPGPPAIPVYTTQEENDVYLRSYLNCPTFQDNLQDFYETDKWKELEQLNLELLTKLARIFPDSAEDGKIPLKDLWNAYDPIHVAMTECGNVTSGNVSSCEALVDDPHLATALSQSEFAKLEALTEKTEHLKYATDDVAGNLLGSNLLWKIIQRTAEPFDGKFFLYSAHAPTMLGFLATLQASNGFVAALNGEHFVEYGSALILEVYQQVMDSPSAANAPLYLKLRYKDSTRETAVDIPMKQDTGEGQVCGTGELDPSQEYCTLTRWTLWATQHTLVTPERWCLACNNSLADVCLRSAAAVNNDAGSESRGTNNQAWMILATFVGGFVGGLIVMVGVIFLCGCHKRTKNISGDASSNDVIPIDSEIRGTAGIPSESILTMTINDGNEGSTENDAVMNDSDDTASDVENRRVLT
jgi:hypothetical protein